MVTFAVETPVGAEQWTLPVPFYLCGGEDDWRRITRMKAWWLPEADQEVLTKVLAEGLEMDATLRLLKLDHDTYCSFPPSPEAVIDHWMMSGKTARRGRKGADWPPPEHLRRRPRN